MFRKAVISILIVFTLSSETKPELSKVPLNPRHDRKVFDVEDNGKSSLAFVFDTTGSMYNDLRQLREGAEMILKTALDDSNVIEDFVFVPFHDPAVGPATVTKNIEVFKAALNIVRVYGGGDCPEKSLGGIQLALNVSRPRSFIYVFTDATASDHRLVGAVLDSVQRKQTQVVFVLTGHCNDLHRPHYKVYEQIAAASSGQVFNLNKNNVHKVLEFVRSSVSGRMVNLASVVAPAGYNNTHNIPIDSSLGEVTVSVSGDKPSIKVVNPAGEVLTGPPKLITTLDLNEIMVVKVLQPEPGNWTITTGSAEQFSVKVVGQSELSFSHGFSVQTAASIAETAHRPLQGTYNHLLISLTGAEKPVEMSYAEIMSLDGRTLFEIPLRIVDSEKMFYSADPFVPPEGFFYIAINGRDENGQELRRIGATAVQAKEPDVPFLTVPKKVEARSHDTIVLKCNIESLVPVTAMWTKDTVKIQPQVSSLQSTSIEYVIEDMKEGDVGSYRCVAKNVAGISKVATDVSLIVDPPQVTITPSNKTVDIGANVTISCRVISDAILSKYLFVFNGTENSYAEDVHIEPNMEGMYVFSKILYNVSETDSGIYACVAENRGGQSNQTTHITIESNPIAQIIGPHTVTKQINTDLQLVCHVENADKLVWLNSTGSVVRWFKLTGKFYDLFEIKNVNDSGIWTCIAVKGGRNASDSVELTVLIKPEVEILASKNITILNGTTVDILCKVVAKPEPRIIWHRETERFLNNTVTVLEPNVYKSVLTLDSSKENVKGTYFCFGENSEGIHQDSVTVNVRRKMILLEGFTDITTELYSQISLPCNIDSYPHPTIKWFHNESELILTNNIYLSENNNTLFIMKVDFYDLGSYKCHGENGFESLSIEGRIIVEGLESPKIAKERKVIVTQKGKSTILPCRAQGKPQPLLRWLYLSNNSTFANLPEGIIVSPDHKELIILNVDEKLHGVYRCIAENVLGSDVYDVSLVVQYPPLILQNSTPSDKPLRVEAGQTISLSCSAAGIPPPVVTWRKDNSPISFNKNIYLTDLNELAIDKLTEYDSGFYTCNVSSILGSKLKNFTIVVYEPPKVSPPGIEPELVVLEGDLVELPCSGRGVPTPEVRWLLNGQPVSEARKRIDQFGLRFIANLTDFGEYVCTVKNEYGNQSLTYSLYIWVPPSIEPPLKVTKIVILGENTSLNCDAVGFPIPSMFWEFDGQLLIENTTELSFNEYGDLNITNATSRHEGLYVCIAENDGGIAKKNFLLKIDEPAKILEDNYTGPYIATNKDTELVISCRTTGKPAPFIVWTKDGRLLEKDSRYETDGTGALTIKNPSEDLSGEYTCIAKNKHGTVNKTVTVEVYPILPTRLQADESVTNVVVLEGSNATVECPARIANMDTVKWYKDAKLIATGPLVITNVTRDNSSTYACVVTNNIGSTYSNIHFDVQWEPHFIPMDEKYEDGKNRDENYNIGKNMDEKDDDGNDDSEKYGYEKLGNLKSGDERHKDAVKGQDVYFGCESDAKPSAKTKWLFNSKPILGEDKPRLKLLNVHRRNSGDYKCIVSNDHGAISRQFTLEVFEPPFISEFDLLDVQLKEGMNATLDCNARGWPMPNIKWIYNNTNWETRNTSLTTTKVSTHSEGLFRCEATNRVGTKYIVYRVEVTIPAAVTDVVLFKESRGEIVDRQVEVTENSRVRLSCSASGRPLPVIQWLRNGNVMSQNSEDIRYADLIIDSIRTQDSGNYVCVASNDGGVDERRIKVDVLEPPKIFQDLFQTNLNSTTDAVKTKLEVMSGQAFSLHCHPYGNPIPEVYWFKDGLILRLFDDTMTSIDYGEVLVSDAAKVEQSGNYTCVARNKVGNASAVYLVGVLVPPPTPKESVYHVTTRLGKELKLTCPVEGSPVPSVMWVKNPYVEISADMPRVMLGEDNFTLTINQTEVSDSGKYSCILTNKVGTTEVTFDVTIEKTPLIAGNVGGNVVERHVVPLRRSVVLKCQTDGHPVPKISWLKDTQQLSNELSNIQRVLGNSLLAIWSANTRDAGQYICIAENSAGSAHRRYNVQVQVPGKWSPWPQWSLCNVTCGLGYQHRARMCHYVDDYNVTLDKTTKSDKIILDESSCKGIANDRRKCHMPPCEEDENESRWSVWSKWSSCSSSCGAGSQARTRRCRTRTPCRGDNVQIKKCPNLPKCSNRNNHNPSNNDVLNSGEVSSEINPYAPEATFEMQPEMVNTQYGTDDEEVYTRPDVKYSTVYYEVNVTGNLDRSYNGDCKPGFKQNNSTGSCDDIDECLIVNNQCHSTQICENTVGAYRCTCPKGFVALGVGQRCLDINECEQDIDGCEFACVNTAGGYVCACPTHLRLHTDKHHCVTPASYRRPYSYEELESDVYLSASVDFPAKYTKNRN